MDTEWFVARRERFMQQIGPNAVAIVPAAPESAFAVAHAEFRQTADFYYLTGCLEPDWVLVLRPSDDKARSTLFIRPRDPRLETYDGARLDPDAARAQYQVDHCVLLPELDTRLRYLISETVDLHYNLGVSPELDRRLLTLLAEMRRHERYGVGPPLRVVDLRASLHELRLRKLPEEIERHRRAAEISAQAHLAALRAMRPGMHEFELQAILESVFREHGARPAYESIVASGANATILHYRKNASPIGKNALVLIDAGCDYQHYNADITRTYPAGGKFDPTQKRAYAGVLAVQESAIAMIKPGVTLEDLNQHCIRGLTGLMVELGLLKGPAADRIADGTYRRFFLHHPCHYLGLDVHDVGAYRVEKQFRPLEPGMIITVEPGLYVAPGSTEVPAHFAGLGIRIEDDVLVTNQGHDVLSRAAPKAVDDLERPC